MVFHAQSTTGATKTNEFYKQANNNNNKYKKIPPPPKKKKKHKKKKEGGGGDCPQIIINELHGLHTPVYDILSPVPAIAGGAIGFENLTANKQFFLAAQTAA